MQYGMVIDLGRCIGCNTCAVSCKNANNLPQGMWWNRILTDGGDCVDTSRGVYPNLEMRHVPINCQHCENPACTKVCPVGATSKDPETGIVKQDYDKCIGCRMCMAACPYTGVRSFNWEEPKYYFDFAIGQQDIAPQQKHTVAKCTLCAQRVEREEDPVCVAVCPARARYFGDFDDPNSEVSKLIASREHMQLLPEKGTNPSVYYLV